MPRTSRHAKKDPPVEQTVLVHKENIPTNEQSPREIAADMANDRIGVYLDSHHMTITGGAGGWKQAIDLLTPWISLVALKNSQWRPEERDDTGQQRWRIEYCRLEDGIAPIPEFVGTIHKAGYRGFYTLHTEYRLPVKQCIKLTTEDFSFLRNVFACLY